MCQSKFSALSYGIEVPEKEDRTKLWTKKKKKNSLYGYKMMKGEATRKVTDFESREEMCANIAVRLGRRIFRRNCSTAEVTFDISSVTKYSAFERQEDLIFGAINASFGAAVCVLDFERLKI
jgi:hypothetical protein